MKKLAQMEDSLRLQDDEINHGKAVAVRPIRVLLGVPESH